MMTGSFLIIFTEPAAGTNDCCPLVARPQRGLSYGDLSNRWEEQDSDEDVESREDEVE